MFLGPRNFLDPEQSRSPKKRLGLHNILDHEIIMGLKKFEVKQTYVKKVWLIKIYGQTKFVVKKHSASKKRGEI